MGRFNLKFTQTVSYKVFYVIFNYYSFIIMIIHLHFQNLINLRMKRHIICIQHNIE